MKNHFFYVLLIVLQLCVSCVENQDFSQTQEVRATPSVEASLLFFEATEEIINAQTEPIFFTELFSFEGFSEAFFAERVVDGTITYEVENTTSKALVIDVEFLDIDENNLDTITLTVAPMESFETIIAYGIGGGRDINIIRNTANFRITAVNVSGDTTSVSSLPDPTIRVGLSGNFRIELIR